MIREAPFPARCSAMARRAGGTARPRVRPVVRALARWREAAGITAGPVFRRIWATPRPPHPPPGWTPAAGLDPDPRGRMVGARSRQHRPHRQGARRCRGLRPRPTRRPQPETRRAQHRQGPARPSRPAQAARPAQELRPACRLYRGGRHVRGQRAQRRAVARLLHPGRHAWRCGLV
jgi:hypothetical protein